MIIRIAKRPRGFTQIDNRTLRDPSISLKAKGSLAWILSYPDDWTGSLEELIAEGPDGRDAIRGAIRELEAAGYVCRRRIRGDDGRWRTELEVHERPGESGKSDITEDGLSVMDVTSGNGTKPQVGTGTGSPASVDPSSRSNTKPRAKTEQRNPPAPPSKPRPRDLIFDAIAKVCQIGEHPTKSEAGQIARAKSEILEAVTTELVAGGVIASGASPNPEIVAGEVILRGREAWRRWAGRPFSPMALSKHWSSLATPASSGNGRGPKYGVTDAWDDLRATIEGGTGNDAGRMAGDLGAPVLGVPVEQHHEREPRRLLHGSSG